MIEKRSPNTSRARWTCVFVLAISISVAIGALASFPAFAGEGGGAGATTATAASMLKETKKLPPGFEPVAGAPESDKLNPNPLVIGAYAMFFVAMFGYIIFVARSQSAMAKEMAELADRIRKTERA